MTPKVTIIMPVYNGEKYLRDAIDSILGQSFENFEFVIVNDGSKDRSDEIIKQYKDKRIRYIVHTKNTGLDQTLNEEFKKAQGEYIARMDCDDISFPKRIEKQVDFLDAHPDFGMIGTQYINMNHDRVMYEVGAQLFDNEEIKLGIQSMNAFCHGSVMFRTSFIKENNVEYNHKYSPYEDYELWTRIAQMTKVCNLPEVLYAYMNNPAGMYLTQYKEMIEGPKRLGEKLRRTMQLPKLTISYFLDLAKKRKRYDAKFVTIHGKAFESNFLLAYQTFLYKLGRVYISRGNTLGVSLILLSFICSPTNWIKEIAKKL